MDEEELNYILINVVPNGWANQFDLKGWDFESKKIKDTCNMFKVKEVTKKVYEGVVTSKKTNWAYENHVVHIRNKKVG